VWIGRTVTIAEANAPTSRNGGFIIGVMILLLVTGFWGGAAYLAAAGLRDVHQVAYVLVGGFLLKTTFSVKMLHQTAARVRELLTAGDMAGVRAQMSSLVSRDPSQLTAEQATAATVESVSENIADSIIGPWLAFALFGLPGAVAYRAINTLDSMIGYHGRYEYLGKASARFDDLVNLIPSRLAGLLLVAASLVLPGQKASDAWRIMLRDHGKTESPNAGWTMSGMAGALGVELEKADHYRLGDATRQVEPEDITRTVRTMYVVAGAGLLLALGITYLRSGIW
jgi:adenosylcobinamide-phosphate synthase